MASYQPRKSRDFAQLVRFLRQAPRLNLSTFQAELVSDSELAEIETATSRNLVAHRPKFEQEPMAALVNWLLRARTSWLQFIRSSGPEAERARGLLHLADYHLVTFAYEKEEKSALTLIVRRLIWFAASGVDIFNRHAMLSLLTAYGSCLLPKPDVARPLPQKRPRLKGTVYFEGCTRSTVNAFLSKSSLFLQGAPINGTARDEIAAEVAEDRDLRFFLNDEGDLLRFRVEPLADASPLASLHEAHAAATSLLAPDPRGLIAIRELLRPKHFDPGFYANMPKRTRLRLVRVLAGFLAALSGISLQEAILISLFPPKTKEEAFASFRNSGVPGQQKVLGYICELSEWQTGRPGTENAAPLKDFLLVSCVGPSRDRGMESRIKDQMVFLPLPRELSLLIVACRNAASFWDSDIQTIGVLLGKDALDRIRSSLERTFPAPARQTNWCEKSYLTFIKRPERAFHYVALVECGIPPPILSLILGHPVGVWRASLNYAGVSQRQVFEATRQVQKCLLDAAGFLNPTWTTFPPRGEAGAGLLIEGKIGPPGIPSLKSLVNTPPDFTSLSTTWARLDYLKRLFGERFCHSLPNPQLDYRDHLGCFAIADKNLGGRVFPRLVPAIDSLARQLAQPIWKELPDNCSPAEKIRHLIRDIREPNGDPNAGRKSLYSELLADRVGDEAMSAIFGHGLVLTKVFGPISPVPLNWFLGQIKEVLEKAATAKINEQVTAIPKISLRQLRRYLETKSQPQLPAFVSQESTVTDVGIQHLPIPEEEAFEFLRKLWEAIRQKWLTFKNRPIELRRCLFLALALHAMPMRRLWRLRHYVPGNALVRTDEGDTFLIAPIPQKDLGMGLIPLRLTAEAAEVIWPMVETLRQIALQRKPQVKDFDSTLLFPNFGRTEFQEVVKLALRFTARQRRKLKSQAALAHLEAGSKFLSRSRFGAQVFNALNGRAIVPPNYFALEDLFYQAWGRPVAFVTVSGKPWRNIFTPSQRRLRREEDRKNGMAKLPAPLTPENLSRFCALHFSFPSAAKIESWLEECQISLPSYRSSPGPKRQKKRLWARRIARNLMLRGDLTVGSPEHLLFPELTPRFFEIFDNRARLASHQFMPSRLLQWWATIVLLLGCRPGEALLLEPGHIDDPFRPRILRIPGTKTESAQRTLDLHLFTQDPVGAWLFRRFMHFGSGRWTFASQTNFRAFQTKLNQILAASYDQLRSEIGLPKTSGTFSLRSLRHACAFRLSQHALTNSLWGGNLWPQLASISTALGHQSMVTTWSSYIGTAALALEWPGRPGSPGYCSLRHSYPDLLFERQLSSGSTSQT